MAQYFYLGGKTGGASGGVAALHATSVRVQCDF
jgi:hypothetical protein